MRQQGLQDQFDAWAQTYDQEVSAARTGFPFEGYARALATIVAEADAAAGMRVLDLGLGTGNLARPLLEAGCAVLGVDFAPAMLARAAAKLPGLALQQADLTTAKWPAALAQRFDRVVSNYVFHEFPWPEKARLLERLAAEHLTRDGRIVIGDIIFPSAAARAWVREAYAADWEEEHYWLADETQAALAGLGWQVTVIPVSFCAGVLRLTPRGQGK